jgi:hypothetical protein
MGSKTKLVATCKDLALRLMDQNRTDWAKALFEAVAKERIVGLSKYYKMSALINANYTR